MNKNNKAWIGVDLDGSLAEYNGYEGPTHIGKPIEHMVLRIRRWLIQDKTVKIITARANSLDPNCFIAIAAIEKWTEEIFGQKLEVVSCKDFKMIEIWDDRAVQLIPNKGLRADGKNEDVLGKKIF